MRDLRTAAFARCVPGKQWVGRRLGWRVGGRAVSDIVDRLRAEADETRSEERELLLREAAALIERLRTDLREKYRHD